MKQMIKAIKSGNGYEIGVWHAKIPAHILLDMSSELLKLRKLNKPKRTTKQ